MFTDIVGFSSLAQRNEANALRLLSRHNDLMRSIIAKYSGREVKTIGDAFLIEFPSALEAVRCSFAIQQEMHDQNIALAPEDRILVRVGIHVGDVVYNSGGDILGDAVNISSRIEPFATPGGICISEQVFDQVRNKVELPLVRMESQKLKNVNQPIDLYRVIMPWESESQSTRQGLLEPRRVGVLPFKNMSPDPNDEYFADGLTEELITSLSNVKDLTVIARTSVMQYKTVSKKVTEIGRELNAGTLVEGSVRKAANRIRITVQMIDAQNDGHLWAQNYDRQLDDIFAIQSDIAERVAKELRIQLVDSVKSRLESKPTEKPEVYTLYLKGKHFWNERNKESILKAIEYFELAVKKDPSFALGYTGLANCYQVIARNALGEYAPNFQKAKEYAMKALDLDPNLAEAHTALAGNLHYYQYDWKGAESEFRRAIELKPSYSTAHQWYSHVLAQQGFFREAMQEISRALELDPFSLAINDNFGNGLYFNKKYDAAIEQFKKVHEMDPSYEPSYTWMAQTYCRVNLFVEAMSEIEALEKVSKSRLEPKLWKAYVLAIMSKTTEARDLLNEVQTHYQTEHISPFRIAEVYFLLGDKDAGFEWLTKAYDSHDGNINLLRVELELEPARNDPRYFDLIRKIGLQ
jgi:adenylate cyclase